MSTSTTKTRAGSPRPDDTKRNQADRRKSAFSLSKHASLPELAFSNKTKDVHPQTHSHLDPSLHSLTWGSSPLEGARISHDAGITRTRRNSAPDYAKSNSRPVWLSFRVEVEKRKHTEAHDARSSVVVETTGSNSASTSHPPSLTSSHASESTLSASSGAISQISQGNGLSSSSQRPGRSRLGFLKKPKSLDLLRISSLGSNYRQLNSDMQSHGDHAPVLLHSNTCTDLQRVYLDGDERNRDRKLGGDIVARATAATKASLFSLPSEVFTVSNRASVDRLNPAMASKSSTTTTTPRESTSTSTITPRTSASTLRLRLKASNSSSTLGLKTSTSTSSLKLIPKAKNLRALRPIARKTTRKTEDVQDTTTNASNLTTGPSNEDGQHADSGEGKGKEKEGVAGTPDEDDKIDNSNVEDDGTTNPSNDEIGSGSSRLRTLRRKKHLNVNILQLAPAGGTKLEPIAISLDDAKVSPDQETSPMLGHGDEEEKEAKRDYYAPKVQILEQKVAQPQSVPRPYPKFVPHTYSYPGRPQPARPRTPPSPTTPTHTSYGHGYAPVVPPSTAPSGLLSSLDSNSLPTLIEPQQPKAQVSPVRLGHPSRPYYSAIRKNFGAGASGVPSHKSSSLSAATGRAASKHQYSSSLSSISSSTGQARPHSYQPPGTPMQVEYGNIGNPSNYNAQRGPEEGTAKSSTAHRHLSMPVVMDAPLRLSAMSIPLIDSLDDEDDVLYKNGDRLLGPEPPTPVPGRISFSLFNTLPSTTYPTPSSASAAISSSLSTGAASVNVNATDTVRRMSRNGGGGILLPSTPPAPLMAGSSSPLSSSPSSSDHDRHHRHSASLIKSLGRASGRGESRNMSNTSSIGRGFSMSGQTELRMALAVRDAAASASSSPLDASTETGFARGLGGVGGGTLSAGVSGGFRFRETQPPPEQLDQIEPPWTALPDMSTEGGGGRERGERKDSFMGHVRKLRRGLKEMIGMESR